MGLLAEKTGKFLNSTQNPNAAISKLQTRITNLRDDLESNTLFVPGLSISFNDMINKYKTIAPLYLYRDLTAKTVVGGKTINTGFSTYLIYNKLNSDPKYLLRSIPSTYSVYYEDLKAIKNTYTLPLYSIENYTTLLCDNIADIYQTTPFNIWGDPTTVFQHIFQQSNFESIDTTDYNSIILLLMYFFIYKVLTRSTDFTSQLFNYMEDNSLLSYTDFQTSFQSYITTNKSIMSSALNSYLLKSVFSINGNSLLFESLIEDEISDLLTYLPDSFDEVFTDSFVTSYINRTYCNLTTQFLLSYNALYFVLFHFYDNKDTYWIVNETALDSVEADFFTELKQLLTDNLHNLKSLEQISLQFNTAPLFLINSYAYSHANWINLILSDVNLWILPTTSSSPEATGRSINTGSYSWVESSVGTNMYYLTFNDEVENILEPACVYQEQSIMNKTDNVELSEGQWAYTDNDSLLGSTIYIRLVMTAGTTYDPDPNNHDDDYLMISPILTVVDLMKMMPLIRLWSDTGSPQGSELIADYVNDPLHKLNFASSNAGVLTSQLTFYKMLDAFFDSDDFKSYVINYFLPSIYDKVKEKIVMEFNVSEHVDEVIVFIKTMFFDDMINNGKLFIDQIDIFNTACQYVIDNKVTTNIAGSAVKDTAQDEFNFVKSYTNVFNSFYISTVTSEYMNNLLDQYRITTT